MKPLRFIHISKTGGQSIAMAAKNQAGVLWGMYDEEYGDGILCHKRLSLVDSNALCNDTLKNQFDWFMVVRNPYTRIVSEYNWKQRTYMDINQYTYNMLQLLELGRKFGGYHFVEQWKYLETQYTIHVLRFENLAADFKELMTKYGYQIELKKEVNVSKKIATLSDLTLDTIEYINRIYAKDFELFGYEMRHDVFSSEQVNP